MKEFEIFVKSLADGLKSFAQGVETVARQLDDYAQSQAHKEEKGETSEEATPAGETIGSTPESTTGSTPESTPGSNRPEPSRAETPKDAQEDSEPPSATEIVLQMILQSRKGVDVDTLVHNTGYGRRKIYNIVFRLKKRELIKNKEKGVYVKA